MYKIDKNLLSLPLVIVFFIFLQFLNSCSFNQRNLKEEREQRIRKEIIRDARSLIGSKYRYAGKTPPGFDCSGFTIYVYKKNNIRLSASSRLQAKQGKKIDIRKAKTGDLVFFGNMFKTDHVGIVTQNKNGKLFVIHSTNSQGVIEHDINQILYWKKRIKFARDVISP